jgi:hypothetical protein
MIQPGYKSNLATLIAAARNGDLGLLECTDAVTKNTVIVVVAMSSSEDGEVTMTPLAKMFDGNPYEELLPPN